MSGKRECQKGKDEMARYPLNTGSGTVAEMIQIDMAVRQREGLCCRQEVIYQMRETMNENMETHV